MFVCDERLTELLFRKNEITLRVFSSMSNSAAGVISIQFGACNCMAWTLVFPKLLKNPTVRLEWEYPSGVALEKSYRMMLVSCPDLPWRRFVLYLKKVTWVQGS